MSKRLSKRLLWLFAALAAVVMTISGCTASGTPTDTPSTSSSPSSSKSAKPPVVGSPSNWTTNAAAVQIDAALRARLNTANKKVADLQQQIANLTRTTNLTPPQSGVAQQNTLRTLLKQKGQIEGQDYRFEIDRGWAARVNPGTGTFTAPVYDEQELVSQLGNGSANSEADLTALQAKELSSNGLSVSRQNLLDPSDWVCEQNLKTSNSPDMAGVINGQVTWGNQLVDPAGAVNCAYVGPEVTAAVDSGKTVTAIGSRGACGNAEEIPTTTTQQPTLPPVVPQPTVTTTVYVPPTPPVIPPTTPPVVPPVTPPTTPPVVPPTTPPTTPPTYIDVCRKTDTGNWVVITGLLESTRKPGDLPANSPECQPPSTPMCQYDQTLPANSKECLKPKDSNPADYKVEQGTAPVHVTTPAAPPALATSTTQTGGQAGSVADTISNPVHSETGVTAGGATAPEPTPVGATTPNQGGTATVSTAVSSNAIDGPTQAAPAPAAATTTAAPATQAAPMVQAASVQPAPVAAPTQAVAPVVKAAPAPAVKPAVAAPVTQAATAHTTAAVHPVVAPAPVKVATTSTTTTTSATTATAVHMATVTTGATTPAAP